MLQSGDPYLEFAKMARAVPSDATRDSHKVQRQQFKTCALGVLFGLSGGAWPENLASLLRRETAFTSSQNRVL